MEEGSNLPCDPHPGWGVWGAVTATHLKAQWVLLPPFSPAVVSCPPGQAGHKPMRWGHSVDWERAHLLVEVHPTSVRKQSLQAHLSFKLEPREGSRFLGTQELSRTEVSASTHQPGSALAHLQFPLALPSLPGIWGWECWIPVQLRLQPFSRDWDVGEGAPVGEG